MIEREKQNKTKQKGRKKETIICQICHFGSLQNPYCNHLVFEGFLHRIIHDLLLYDKTFPRKNEAYIHKNIGISW